MQVNVGLGASDILFEFDHFYDRNLVKEKLTDAPNYTSIAVYDLNRSPS